MIRKIIRIDENKCNGCGACAAACHEGAIAMIDGVAKLTREDYCDGLGDCLPTCPTGAISFEEREAPAYNEAAVKQHKNALQSDGSPFPQFHQPSQLTQWPVQIKLMPVSAPYYQNANLLIAADCTAFAYGNFHNHFIRNHIVVIGCPKLDDGDYGEKLAAIIANNEIKSITIVRMEVPCCRGLEFAAKQALQASGKFLPWRVVIVSTDGTLLEE